MLKTFLAVFKWLHFSLALWRNNTPYGSSLGKNSIFMPQRLFHGLVSVELSQILMRYNLKERRRILREPRLRKFEHYKRLSPL